MSEKSRSRVTTSVAGALAQTIEICITFPLEFCKGQLQLAAQEKRQLTLKQCIKQTQADFGFKGFYRGMQFWIVGSPLRGVLKFQIYDAVANRFLRQKLDWDQKLCSSVGGFCAGLAESIFVNTPAQSVQVKMADDSRQGSAKYRGFFRCTGLVYKRYGIAGFTDGMFPTCVKGGINNIIRFGFFYSWKQAMAKDSQPLSLQMNLLGGALAGFISVLVTQPVDTVKSCMQGLERSRYPTAFHCARNIVATNGILGLYQGLQARFCRVILEQMIMFGLFEEICKVVDPFFEQKEKFGDAQKI